MIFLAIKRKPAAKKKAADDAVQAVGEADAAKAPEKVESFDCASEPHETVLTLNGHAYAFDREALLAVAKLLNAARVETNY